MKPTHLFIFIFYSLITSLSHAQILVDDYGFYRSWQELNDAYITGEVELQDNGLPGNTNLKTNKATEKNLFTMHVYPENPSTQGSHITPPFNQIHSWLIELKYPDGSVAHDAELEFFGGMPLHNHGFPTAPIVQTEIQPGVYRLEGVKFSMMGWWQFAFAIKAQKKTDTVRINLLINP